MVTAPQIPDERTAIHRVQLMSRVPRPTVLSAAGPSSDLASLEQLGVYGCSGGTRARRA